MSAPMMRTSTLWLLGVATAVGCAAANPGDDADGGGPGVAPTSVSTPCPDDAAYFADELWKPVLSKKCAGCHRAGGLAGGSRLVLSETDATVGFAGAVALAKEAQGGVATLVARPAGLFADGHPGGTLTPPGTSAYARLSTFVDRVAHGVCDGAKTTCSESTPGKRRLRRLTRAEYERTVRDLFALPATFTAGLTADTVVAGFDNHADALSMSPLLAEQLRKSAEKLAADAAKKLPACQGAQASCADALLSSVGRRIFRRPLSTDERARYAALYATIEKDEPGAGAEVVLSALLQSPHFLYRSELGGVAKGGLVALTPHELASSLSYLLWGTTPDDALLDAADTGALGTEAGLTAQVTRLMNDPRSKAALDGFFSQWLDIERIDSIAKDAATYPTFDPAMRAAMREETRRFVDHVVREKQGTLAELLTARFTFADGPLAAMYGVTAGSDGQASLDGTTRAGLLTQASVLSVHGSASGSSPIHRGKLVRERLLCQPLPPPPPSLNVQLPAVDPTLSTRERFAAHATVEPCVGCHRKIDPIGFAFEGFDGIGAARATEAGHPVNTVTDVLDAGTVSGTVKDAVQLGQKLAASPEVHACFATQWVRFGFGVDDEEELPCLTEALRTRYQDGDGSVGGLLRALIASAHFTRRMADPDVDGAPMGPETPGGAGGAAGQGGAPAAAGAAGQATAGTTGAESTVTVTQKVDTQWATGECRTVTVANPGATKVTWKVSIDVAGTLSDVWNATASAGPAPGQQSFVGVEWNAVVAPSGAASFGFCVAK